jgi:hypothetical protein
MWLLTSVLDAKQLTRRQLVKCVGGLKSNSAD